MDSKSQENASAAIQAHDDTLNEKWQIKGNHAPPHDPLLECLLTITKLQNNPFSKSALVSGLPLVNHQLTPELFIRAADRAGLAAKMLKKPIREISPIHTPAVLLLKKKNACVLVRISNNGKAVIIQPEAGSGVKEVDIEVLQDMYAGYVIFVKPEYSYEERSKPETNKKYKHWFWGVMLQSIPTYKKILMASFLLSLFALATPLFIMNVYDRVVPNNAIATLWVLSIGVFLVFLFEFVIRDLRSYFIDVSGKNIDIRLSAAIFEQLLGMKMGNRPRSVGNLANTVQAYEAFRDFLTSASVSIIIDVPFVLVFLYVIWLLGGILVLIPVALIPLVILVGYFIQVPLNQLIQDNYKNSAEKHATLIESLNGVETLKAMGAESTTQRRWENVVCVTAKMGVKIRFLANLCVNFSTYAHHMSMVLVVIGGVYLIANGDMTTGALIACTILTGRALAPMAQIANLVTRYHQASAAIDAVDQIMKTPVERPHGKTHLHRPTLHGHIEFRNVSFSYDEQAHPALSKISFKIMPGEKVGIVGKIGSGKTTLEKLLLNLYKPTAGTILVDGTDIQQIDPYELRHNFGYVPQDIMLFYGSIKDNIVLSAPYADDESILRAALISGVDTFVKRHPQGFDRNVGENGGHLSGGQRQTIAIARSLLLNPPILLLDEPTNSMDDASEALFRNNLKQIYLNKTLLLVTHRGSMLELVNRLIVLDNGSIVADGPKEKVLQELAAGKVHASTN